MPLKFANYPPLLSHLLMIVFGMGLHNILTPASPPKQIHLRPQRVYIVVSKKMQIYGKLPRQEALAFAIKTKARPRCALPARGARLQHRYEKTLLLSLTQRQATRIIQYLQQGSLEGVFGARDPHGLALPQCKPKPTVTYRLP